MKRKGIGRTAGEGGAPASGVGALACNALCEGPRPNPDWAPQVGIYEIGVRPGEVRFGGFREIHHEPGWVDRAAPTFCRGLRAEARPATGEACRSAILYKPLSDNAVWRRSMHGAQASEP